MVGIYRFQSKTTGMSYIGQSICIEKRYLEHQRIGTLNLEPQNKWYQALNKYGIDDFEFSILEECSPDKLNDREIYWINYYDSFYHGYNSTPGGQAAIYNYDEIYEAWDEGLSVGEIANRINCSTSTIYNALNGYKNYNVHESKRRGGEKIQSTDNTIIYQYDKAGHFVAEWKSAKEAARTLKISNSQIGKVANGNQKTAGGYQWSRIKYDNMSPIASSDNRNILKIAQYDLKGNLIAIYNSLKEAGEAVKGDPSFIRRVTRNGNNAYGYKWKVVE